MQITGNQKKSFSFPKSVLSINQSLLLVLIFFVGVVVAVFSQPTGKINISSIANSFDQNAGHYVLPAEVQQMEIILKRARATTFALSPGHSNLVYQRAIEYLYPARLDPKARLVFAPLETKLPDCQLLIKEKIAAYACN